MGGVHLTPLGRSRVKKQLYNTNRVLLFQTVDCNFFYLISITMLLMTHYQCTNVLVHVYLLYFQQKKYENEKKKIIIIMGGCSFLLYQLVQ